MEQILDTNYANVAYDRESDAIIAVWKEVADQSLVRKILATIEFGFSKYNAKYVITDTTCFPDCSQEAFTDLLKDLIQYGLKKLALIGIQFDNINVLHNIGMIGGCEVKYCDCLVNAQAWVNDKNSHL